MPYLVKLLVFIGLPIIFEKLMKNVFPFNRFHSISGRSLASQSIKHFNVQQLAMLALRIFF
jgi:hypothetical protein